MWGLCALIWNNDHLPVDRWEVISSSAPEWTRQAWMETMFCDEWAFLLFHVWWLLVFWYQRLCSAYKMNIGSLWCNESYTTLCHNVTQIVPWPVTSYGGAGDKSPASRVPINRFGKKNSFHFNIKIEKPAHWFKFWTSVILWVWPNDDNHYTFSVFTHFSSENMSIIRSCWHSRGSGYATEFQILLSRYQPFVFHRKPNGRKNSKDRAKIYQSAYTFLALLLMGLVPFPFFWRYQYYWP